MQVCGRCFRLGKRCRALDLDHERLTVCFECDIDSKCCPRKVEFMATMLARDTHRPVEAIIEEWEAELTPSRELYQKILELRAALEKTEGSLRAAQNEVSLHSWRLLSAVGDKENELATEKRRVAMMIGLTAESNEKAEKLEDMNAKLKQRIEELEEDNKRLEEEVDSWRGLNH